MIASATQAVIAADLDALTDLQRRRRRRDALHRLDSLLHWLEELNLAGDDHLPDPLLTALDEATTPFLGALPPPTSVEQAHDRVYDAQDVLLDDLVPHRILEGEE
jgi:hypothetical protein